MEDHDYVKKAYRRFQKLDPEDDREEAQALVKNVCAPLSNSWRRQKLSTRRRKYWSDSSSA